MILTRPALAAAVGVALTAGVFVVLMGHVAEAQTPPSEECVQAQAALALALPPVTELAPEVYPSDTVPAVGDLNEPLLRAILADPDLGEGGRAVTQTALDAFVAAEAACRVAPAPTTTQAPAPTTTQAPAPTTTQAPAPTRARQQYGQVGRVPVGSVDTGTQ